MKKNLLPLLTALSCSAVFANTSLFATVGNNGTPGAVNEAYYYNNGPISPSGEYVYNFIPFLPWSVFHIDYNNMKIDKLPNDVADNPHEKYFMVDFIVSPKKPFAYGLVMTRTASPKRQIVIFSFNSKSGSIKELNFVAPTMSNLNSIVIAPDGKYLYATDEVQNKIYKFSIEPDGNLKSLGVAETKLGPIVSIAFTNGGTSAYGITGTGKLISYSVTTQNGDLNEVREQILKGFIDDDFTRLIRLSPDNKYAYINLSKNSQAPGVINCYSLVNGDFKYLGQNVFDHNGIAINYTISPDGQYLFAGSNDPGSPPPTYKINPNSCNFKPIAPDSKPKWKGSIT